MNLKKIAGGALKAALPFALIAASPDSLINVAAGGVAKHVKPGGKGINNQNIPVLSVLATSAYYYLTGAASSGDWVTPIVPAIQQGVQQTGMGWAIHQSIKVPLAQAVTGPVAERVGPGSKFSI